MGSNPIPSATTVGSGALRRACCAFRRGCSRRRVSLWSNTGVSETSSPCIEVVTLSEFGLVVAWSDGLTDELSAIWLRHNCHCHECRHPSGQRLIDLIDIDPDAQVSGVTSDNDQLKVRVDTHVVTIPTAALRHRRSQDPGPTTWDHEHMDILVSGATSVFGDLLAARQQLDTWGIALLTDVPTEPGKVLEIARQLGYVRETNYGVLFDVVAEPDPNNLASTALGLPLHTDNPYRDPVPTVQLLHCLQSGSTGGASQFADGFRAAELLSAHAPDSFDVLSSNDVTFRFADSTADLRARVPVIQTDNSGNVTAIRLNSRSIAAIDLDAATTERFYAALRTFIEIVSGEESVVEIMLDAGNLVAFDNRRVLHGRSEFDVTDRRHLQGCYIDIDAVRSDVLVAAR